MRGGSPGAVVEITLYFRNNKVQGRSHYEAIRGTCLSNFFRDIFDYAGSQCCL